MSIENRATHRVRFFQDKRGKFRWKMISINGNTVAESGQGYKTMIGALNGYRAVKGAFDRGSIEARQLESGT